MKKVYILRSKAWGNPYHYTFTNKKDVEKYAKLDEDFVIEELNIYEDIDEFKTNNKKTYLRQLEETIDQLDTKLEKIKFNEIKLEVEIPNDKTYILRYSDLETIVNTHSFPDEYVYFRSQDEKFGENFIDFMKYSKKFVEKNMDTFVEASQKAYDEWQSDKKLLRQCKLEYIKLAKELNVETKPYLVSNEEDEENTNN